MLIESAKNPVDLQLSGPNQTITFGSRRDYRLFSVSSFDCAQRVSTTY